MQQYCSLLTDLTPELLMSESGGNFDQLRSYLRKRGVEAYWQKVQHSVPVSPLEMCLRCQRSGFSVQRRCLLSEEVVRSPEELVRSPEEVVRSPEELVRSPEQAFRVPEEMVWSSEEALVSRGGDGDMPAPCHRFSLSRMHACMHTHNAQPFVGLAKDVKQV
jgi:hypothetical protein